jgi:hypothetical protein
MLCLIGSYGRAEVFNLHVDSARSELTFTALQHNVFIYPVPGQYGASFFIAGQDATSFTASYTGNLLVDLNLAGNTVEFLDGAFAAIPTGDRFPVADQNGDPVTGSADYAVELEDGGTLTGYQGTINEVVFAPLPTTHFLNSLSEFEASDQVFNVTFVTRNYFPDWDTFGAVNQDEATRLDLGSLDINGQIVDLGNGEFEIHLPVHAVFRMGFALTGNSAAFSDWAHFEGLIVASTIPEVTSGVLASSSIVLAFSIYLVRRRYRRGSAA